MQQLSDAMSAQFQRLKFGGRAVVITFKPREAWRPRFGLQTAGW